MDSPELKTMLEKYGNYAARHYMHSPGVGDLSIDEVIEQIEAHYSQRFEAALGAVVDDPKTDYFVGRTAKAKQVRARWYNQPDQEVDHEK